MEITDASGFVMWVTLTLVGAIGLGAIISIFAYERVSKRHEERNELEGLQGRYDEAMKDLVGLRARIAELTNPVSTVETGWVPPPPPEEFKIGADGLGRYWRIGHKIHADGCFFVDRAHNPIHLWACNTEEAQLLAYETNLDPCKHCKPFDEESTDVPEEEAGTEPSDADVEGGEGAVEQPANSGGAAQL